MTAWFVLPAYNEEKALPLLLDRLAADFRDHRQAFKVLVVNDGSQDETLEIARQYAAKWSEIEVIDQPQNRGLAGTLKNGLLEALRQADDADVIVAMDADNTQPPALALRMLALIREGNDVVIASRYRFGSAVIGLSFLRKTLSYGASWIFRLTFPTRGVKDYTCGYRAYRVTSLRKLREKMGDEQFIRATGFSCMVELLLNLRKLGTVFTEVPMVLRYDWKPGLTKMRVAKTVFETLGLVFRRRFFSTPLR